MELYVVCADMQEWEDLIIFVSKELAINYSKKHPTVRLELFTIDDTINGYIPTYFYYLDGEYIDSMKTVIS